jgi:membrane-associated phospholipid phosphatase
VGASLKMFYNTFDLQLLLIPFILSLLRRPDDIFDFLILLFMSAIPLSVFAALYPAQSHFLTSPQSGEAMRSVSHFVALRDGSFRIFDVNKMQGLISFPSFHAMGAVFFIYALRNTNLFFRIGILMNFLMVIATPTEGGHYLVDVFAGLFLACFLILCLRKIKARCKTKPQFETCDPG